jgi:multisubunit Na+/H+ antiporter MnhF subunit
MSSEETAVLRTPVPGALFEWVKRASYVELALFAALIVVWVAPGLEQATAVLGLAHGLGFIGLAVLIWVAVLRHEAPYTLLAATLTPVGPVGSVIAIHYLERNRSQT